MLRRSGKSSLPPGMPSPPDRWDQRPHPAWQPVEIPLDDERTLVLEAT
ncbi:MAG: hypothetical protein NTW21_12045 [Verrucomicrobia bacterium]|nr:hypothetical protein [Verrucomicrobiota bacterium]